MQKLANLVLMCFCMQLSFGQVDTSYLTYDQLDLSDMDLSAKSNQTIKVIAGTRTEQDLEDLPFTVFVITAKEIREQGYFTLVDALKNLPGIRVSQPGSGLDGESFMMRGLYGNTYAKILINDVPIRPSVVGGMPIGSQLPIRQAERIEVIYGPAATLYGSDAAAGVINIILKDSEHPTFVQADIEIGKNNLTRLSALFGGKFSVGKKIMKVRMFGGYTSFSDREIKYNPEQLYNPQVYEDFLNLGDQTAIEYEERPNFIGKTGTTILSSLPHLSSHVGLSATIGDFDFGSQRMFRIDHSSIGLNPYAVSYADPQSQIGEEIVSTSFAFKHFYDKWNFSIRLNNLNYNMNPLSSYKHVLPLFGTFSNAYSLGRFGETGLDPNTNVPATIDSLYLSGSRYVSSSFNDFSLELQSNINIHKAIDVSLGLHAESGEGDAIERYLKEPPNTINEISPPPFTINPNATFSSINWFVESYLKLGSFSVIAGIQSFVRSDGLLVNDPVYNPRIGLLYRSTPTFSVRASYSEAFRYPSAFYNNSSYTISSKNGVLDIETGSPGLEPEETINIETGVRFNPSNKLNLDFSFYYTKTSNFINFDIVNNEILESFFLGYENDPNSFSQLIGGQLSLKLKNILPAIKFSTDINLNYSKGKERILQVFFDDSQESQLQDIPVVRAQPDFIGHVRMSFEPLKNMTIFLNHSFMTSSWTRNKLRITSAIQNNQVDRLKNKGYYTLNVRSQFKISRQLNAYIDLGNLLNTKYAGIDAVVHIDGLLYNPQPLFMFKVGVNFSFN
jgi:outer membrane receptor protein involved in Fe transport